MFFSGQTGAMVSTIRKNNLLLVFEGYLNKGETNKKVIYNVFRKGDSAFVSGSSCAAFSFFKATNISDSSSLRFSFFFEIIVFLRAMLMAKSVFNKKNPSSEPFYV